MRTETLLTQLIVLTIALIVWLLYNWDQRRQQSILSPFLWGGVTLYALLQIGFTFYAWANRVSFPLNLEVMELLKLQHVQRLLAGQALYVEPSSTFIPLVYNPLYYYLVLPFTWLLGANLFAMRVAAIVGAVGAYAVTLLAVRRQTGSIWWGLMALGLLAAALRVMDTYLDNAAADSWTLFSILLGCYLIDRNQSRALNWVGVLCLIAAFWFKQYGAIFTIGGVLFLTWREGWRRAWPYWGTAILLGPMLYGLMPARWMGAYFHYYTWAVPRQWAEFHLNSTVLRVVKYVIKYYAGLAATALGASLWLGWHTPKAASIWHFSLLFALLSGPYVALDPGNNNNVFIPLGAWLIIVGVIGLKQAVDWLPRLARWGAPIFVLTASFALLFYVPAQVLIPANAAVTYRDLVTTLEALDGPVYAPSLGQLQDKTLLSPTVHWVPLIDIIRYPGADLCNQPLVRQLLDPVLHPTGPAYILMEHPLEEDAMLAFLAKAYVLETDFGNRFRALQDSPKLLAMGWPTYLYRYTPVAGVEPAWACG